MKKSFFFMALFLFGTSAVSIAQGVGINADGLAPDPSAMLDVRSSNKGLLIPQVALSGTADNTTIASAATSLLIYNTATAGTAPANVTPGYYYWNGAVWTRLTVSENGSGATNFLTKWSPAGKLGNSILYNDGNLTGIGTTDPRSAFNVANGGLAIGWGNGISTTHGAKRSLQILTDTYYGGLYDNHSGYLIYSTMPEGWGSATLNFAVSTSWGDYNTSNPALTIKGSGVGIGTTSPAGSAALDVSGTGKGLLIPRMTLTQIQYISSPANGLEVFCTDNGKMYIYVGSSNQWKEVAYGTGILTPSTCGYTIFKSHTAGDVAPVSKQVTYGIVTSVPGEPNKCWITSNLGADHQATAVDDATEASAGWYWQFNRKQGYKHDGTTRTPNTTWINSINENSDWTTANDPCNIELGATWRLPTYTEWYNVDNTGGWTNWNGPWGSGLKLHAAGYLLISDGSLLNRGSYGYYWSSTQYDASYGWRLYFSSGLSTMSSSGKAYGFSARCVRD